MTQTSQFINSFSFPNTSPLSLDSSNLSDLLGTKQKKADLGPIWSEDELKIFLKYFKQSGLKEIESMQAELQEAGYKRTVNNLLAIYLKNRNFLNYNPACTAKDLYAIMADRYQNIEESVIPTFPEAPALRKLKSVTSDSKPEGKSTISKDMDSFEDSLRVKNDGLTLKKKSTSVKRNGPPVDESLFNSSYKPKRIHTSNSVIPRERVKKQRKSTVTRGKFPVNYDLHDEDLFKNIEVGCRACGGKSKKSYHYFEAKNMKNNKDFSAPFLKFVNNEILYSPIDAPYFESNGFQKLLGNNEQTDLNLTRDEWSVLRSCMGKPRRFSNKFISDEQEKLQNYRKVVRNYLYEGVSLPEKRLQPITTQKIKALKPLQVSQIVLAVHPNCQHIHPGSILTITGDSVIIKFLPTELGAVSVPDSNVVPISQEEASQIIRHYDRNNTSLAPIPMNRSWSEPDGDRSPLEKKVVEDIDLNAFSMIIKMLEKKTALVSELRKYNNLAENDPESLNEKLKQEFGWTGAQTKLLDNALKNILTKSRLRGANNYDTEFISENLDNLLQKPLRNMLDAGKRQGQDEKEMNAINEIKSLLNKNVEEKISGQIKALTEKFSDVHLNSQCESRTTRSMDENEDKNEKDFEEKHRVGQDISTCERSDDKDTQEVVEKISPVDDQKENLKSRIVDDCSSGEKKNKLKMLANNMIGVLFSLKYQGDLNMKDNKYLTELHTEIFEENAEEFHEINTVLLNVCTR